jgi:hypothetical protein
MLPIFGFSLRVIYGALLFLGSMPSLCLGQELTPTARGDPVLIVPQTALDVLKLTKAGIGEDIILRQLSHDLCMWYSGIPGLQGREDV